MYQSRIFISQPELPLFLRPLQQKLINKTEYPAAIKQIAIRTNQQAYQMENRTTS